MPGSRSELPDTDLSFCSGRLVSTWQVIADYIDITDLVAPPAVPAVVIAAPDDDEVIADAVAAGGRSYRLRRP